MRYKYYIEMTYKNNNTYIGINPENIKHLFIDTDFDNDNMPRMYGVFHLDKNIIDEITLNAKTATIFVNIQKVVCDDETGIKLPTNYIGECVYFISNDINYNKEIDYAAEPDREDIYKQIHMGLMFKNPIEYNKQTVNTTIMNTTMLNSVMQFFQNIPLLLEGFTYNDVIEQLVVPPQDSLSKTVAFFNSVKVFYDTHYRFFMDNKCAYLISSSGKAVPRADEKYSSVIFSVHPVTDNDAMVLGMEEDDENKCYNVDVNVIDTKYTIDNDTFKTVNSLTSIINPSKENDILNSDGIKGIMESIEAKFKDINDSVQSKVDQIKSMPNALRGIRIGITDNSNKANVLSKSIIAHSNDLITQIKLIPDPQPPTTGTGTGTGTTTGTTTTTTPPPFTMTPEEKQKKIKEITDSIATITSETATFCSLKSLIGGCCNGTINTMQSTTNLPSAINAITTINAFENKNFLQTMHNTSKAFNLKNATDIKNTLMPKIGNGQTAGSSASSILAIANELGGQVPDILKIATALKPDVDSYNSQVSMSAASLTNYQAMPDILGSIHESINGSVFNVAKLKTDLSDYVTNYKTELGTLTTTAKQNIANLVASAGKVGNMLSSKGLTPDVIANIGKDITKIKDISQIGKLGVSALDVKLSFVSDGSGNQVIRVNNDNVNYLKNLKSLIENKANKLALNKVDLDCDVFTINKEYTIKNYDAHSNKDGTFLLSRKVETFLREDDKFVLNIMLEFDKLAVNIASTESKDAMKTSDQPITQ